MLANSSILLSWERMSICNGALPSTKRYLEGILRRFFCEDYYDHC